MLPRRPDGALPLRPRRARRRHRHGAPGTEHRPRPHGRRERLSGHAAARSPWHSSTGAKMVRGARSSSPTSASRSIRRRGSATCPIGQQQLIELARVLFSGARIIILDEPTSALSPPRSSTCSAILRKLKASGARALSSSRISSTTFCESPTRSPSSATAGRSSADSERGDRQGLGHRAHDRPSAIRSLKKATSARSSWTRGPMRRCCSRRGRSSSGRAFRDISLTVRAGEVLGIYGFMGGGQLELARALFGKMRPRAGTARDRAASRSGSTSTSAAAQGRHRLRAESRRAMLFHHEPLLQERVDRILERISRLWLKPRRRAQITQGAHRRPARSDHPGANAAARQPVRRQPAEGGAGQVADPRAEGADPRASRPAAWMSAPRRT